MHSKSLAGYDLIGRLRESRDKVSLPLKKQRQMDPFAGIEKVLDSSSQITIRIPG
jgi:hypothetical protein